MVEERTRTNERTDIGQWVPTVKTRNRRGVASLRPVRWRTAVWRTALSRTAMWRPGGPESPAFCSHRGGDHHLSDGLTKTVSRAASPRRGGLGTGCGQPTGRHRPLGDENQRKHGKLSITWGNLGWPQPFPSSGLFQDPPRWHERLGTDICPRVCHIDPPGTGRGSL